MPNRDELLAAIGAAHAAGLDAELWPEALRRIAKLLGSSAATMEVYELPSGRLLELQAVGIPPAEQLDYFEHYAAINPRAKYAFQQPSAQLAWDYNILDEAAMDRDPYYCELLPRTDFRYFMSGNLLVTKKEYAVVTVQRTRAQGHVTAAEIVLMQRLVPHLQQAHDVTRRLRSTAAQGHSLQGALDWLADGVALLAADGEVVYANDALQCIARRGDGIFLKNGALTFTDSQARDRLAAAFAAISRPGNGAGSANPRDFPVARASQSPPYLLSLRPLERTNRSASLDGSAVAIVFVHDPLRPETSAVCLLREVFGFTPAEASLAQALQTGTGPPEYAREHGVSLNTVYTHLRRIKEKTSCKRMSDLIGKLRDLQVSLRAD